MSPSKPTRRRRAQPRQRECGFCGEKKTARTERMATCHECGRSGMAASISFASASLICVSAHPTCLQLGPSIGELIQTYEWVCIECKKCEICLTKGDDVGPIPTFAASV